MKDGDSRRPTSVSRFVHQRRRAADPADRSGVDATPPAPPA
jgi:hypothetical protein